MSAVLSARYQESPLWKADAPTPSPNGGELPNRAEVVVVGGGYAGLTAAWELAARGRTVVLLEARELGFGGSTRNGGMVIPELKHGVRTLTKRYGALGRRLHDAVDDAFALVEELATGIDCDYARAGRLLLAHRPSQVRTLQAMEREYVDDLGDPAHFVPRDQLHSEIGSDAFLGGLVMERTGGLQPAKFHAGLVRHALAAGAQLVANTPAMGISGSGGEFVVQTPTGAINTGDVLVVTNAYADDLLPELQRAVLPIGSFIIATEALPATLQSVLIPERRMVVDTKNFLFYWRLSPDGRMVFGGRTGLGATTIAKSRDVLADAMVRIHPQLAGVPVEYAWGGNVAITYDRLPHAGRIDGVAFATGCNGTGIALATWFGNRMAAWMCGERAPVFTELTLPQVPLHRLRRWYLPGVGAWFRLRDRL